MIDFVRLAPFYVPSVKMAVLYVGINALITLFLALNVVRWRMRAGVNLGEGDSEPLQRAIRVHANNVEYVPLTLLAIGGIALLGAPVWLVDALGIVLTVARILHAIGLSQSSGRSFGRAAGAGLTWLVLLVAAVACILYGLAALPTLPVLPPVR